MSNLSVFFLSKESFLIQSHKIFSDISYTNVFLGQSSKAIEIYTNGGCPGGSVVKNPPANIGNTRHAGLVLGGEDTMEKEMPTHSSILD